jgi:uncharacterized membrane protein
MTKRPSHWPDESSPLTEHAVEQMIGRILQIGVLVSAIVVIVGGIGLLVRYGRSPANFQVFRPESSETSTLGGIIRGAAARDSRAIVQLGLVLLIATPVVRVALTVGAFWRQRDRLYVAITLFVLVLLVYGLFWGTA